MRRHLPAATGLALSSEQAAECMLVRGCNLQGLQRRLRVRLRQSTEKGGLPLAFNDIATVAVGSIYVPKNDDASTRALDSYEESQLDELIRQWLSALDKRQRYLNEQLRPLQGKSASEKNAADVEREASLIRQWMLLTEVGAARTHPACSLQLASTLLGAKCSLRADAKHKTARRAGRLVAASGHRAAHTGRSVKSQF